MAPPQKIADVLIPLALDTAYSYAVPDALELQDGDVVQVPLGTRETVGVVWALREGAGVNLKPVAALLDAPLTRAAVPVPHTPVLRSAR